MNDRGRLKGMGVFVAACLLTIAVLLQPVAAHAAGSDTLKVKGTAHYELATQVVTLVNKERANAGLAPLSVDYGLTETAMQRSAECSIYFDHTRPDGTDCFTAFPSGHYTKAENIAAGVRSAEAVMRLWMQSPGHRSNILDRSLKSIGVGCVQNGNFYWTQCFGTKASGSAKKSAVDVTYTLRASNSICTLGVGFNLKQDPSSYQKYNAGETKTLTVGITNAGWKSVHGMAAPSSFSWSSSNKGVATVDANGNVKAINAGTATITARSAGGHFVATTTVTVTGSSPVVSSPSPAATSTGWLKQGGAWYYYTSNGSKATGWQNLGGAWYWFNGSGAMTTGWQVLGGSWYYFNGSGAMVTGWQSIDGAWYYFNGSGAMVTGWTKQGSTWYYLTGSGAMKTGWIKLGGSWYYFNGSGAMVTGWQKIGSAWYYFSGSGDMLANRWVGNYYLQSDGSMATNRWIGRYHVNASGAWDRTA